MRGAYSDYMQATALSNARRMLAFTRFALGATLAALRGPRPDVIYATSPPLTMALPALVAAARWRAPLVFEVRDLWPEAPIQMGALRNPLARRLARAVERFVYSTQHAGDRPLARNPGGRSAGQGGAGPQFGRPRPLRSEPRRAGRSSSAYFGAMGEANDLTAAVEAARLLPDVPFVLMGDGKRRADWSARRRRTSSSARVERTTWRVWPRESAVCLTLFKDVPVLATNSPNKLFDTFAAGRPAIVNMDGWMRELVEQNEAGVYVRAGDASDLAEKLAWLRDNPDEAARMGRNARALAEGEFSRDELASRARRARGGGALIELSYCVVNTGGRDYLLDCLAAIERTHPEGLEYEVLVLDNASGDGSAEAVREHHPDARLFALERREGKADNDSRLLKAAHGRYCLLLNEDSELRDGAAARAIGGARGRYRAPRRPARSCSRARASPPPAPGACPTSPGRLPPPCSRRTALRCRAQATRCARSAGCSRAPCWSAGRPPRRSAGSTATSSSIRTRPTSAAGCSDAGWRILFVPGAQAVHHDQLGTDSAAMRRRIVEFHRNRELYFRKHGMQLTAWSGESAGPRPASRAPPPRRSCPAAMPAATCCTRGRSCSQAAARASARPRRHQPRACPITSRPRHGAR